MRFKSATAPATVIGLKAAGIAIGGMRKSQSTAGNIVRLEKRHSSEKAAASK